MKFLTGKDYPELCPICRAAIDRLADLYVDGLMPDTDNPEAPCDAVYDERLFCGGGECVNKGGESPDTDVPGGRDGVPCTSERR